MALSSRIRANSPNHPNSHCSFPIFTAIFTGHHLKSFTVQATLWGIWKKVSQKTWPCSCCVWLKIRGFFFIPARN
jgi:hypothetical protein